MSEAQKSASAEELSDERLDTVTGGIIIVGGSFLLPAVQRSSLLGGQALIGAQPGDPCVPIVPIR